MVSNLSIEIYFFLSSVARKPGIQAAKSDENFLRVYVGLSGPTMFCLCVCSGRLSESRVLRVAVGDGAG